MVITIPAVKICWKISHTLKTQYIVSAKSITILLLYQHNVKKSEKSESQENKSAKRINNWNKPTQGDLFSENPKTLMKETEDDKNKQKSNFPQKMTFQKLFYTKRGEEKQNKTK